MKVFSVTACCCAAALLMALSTITEQSGFLTLSADAATVSCQTAADCYSRIPELSEDNLDCGCKGSYSSAACATDNKNAAGEIDYEYASGVCYFVTDTGNPCTENVAVGDPQGFLGSCSGKDQSCNFASGSSTARSCASGKVYDDSNATTTTTSRAPTTSKNSSSNDDSSSSPTTSSSSSADDSAQSACVGGDAVSCFKSSQFTSGATTCGSCKWTPNSECTYDSYPKCGTDTACRDACNKGCDFSKCNSEVTDIVKRAECNALSCPVAGGSSSNDASNPSSATAAPSTASSWGEHIAEAKSTLLLALSTALLAVAHLQL